MKKGKQGNKRALETLVEIDVFFEMKLNYMESTYMETNYMERNKMTFSSKENRET